MNTVTTEQDRTVVAIRQPQFSLAPRDLTEAMNFADMMANSELVPKHFRGKPGDVLIAVQMGQEVGMSPMASIQNIAVINGKPGIYGDAGKAILLGAGCIIEEDDIEIIKATGRARCKVTRRGRPPVERTYAIDNAKTAGLWGKEGPWRTNPERQMAWRAFWFAARDAAADLLKGLGGAEELSDYSVPAERDITPQGTGERKLDSRQTLTLDVLLDKHTKDVIDAEGVVTKFSTKSKVQNGDGTAQGVIDFLAAKYILPEEVIAEIKSWEQKSGAQ
jgi:hypothetical protein